jgi:hypothetical protein
MGVGILSARRLMDQFDIASGPSGTRITVGKRFPASAGFISCSAISTKRTTFFTIGAL